MSQSRQDGQVRGAPACTGKGLLGQSPPRGKVGFQEPTGWQEKGSPHLQCMLDALGRGVAAWPHFTGGQREAQGLPWCVLTWSTFTVTLVGEFGRPGSWCPPSIDVLPYLLLMAL